MTMDRVYGKARYTSCRTKNKDEGYEGFDLVRVENGETKSVARVVFWDANGQFWVETFGTDVPLIILEELIAETKENVKIR
jgi:hypothetical protein